MPENLLKENIEVMVQGVHLKQIENAKPKIDQQKNIEEV